jgi:hypothetical protein
VRCLPGELLIGEEVAHLAGQRVLTRQGERPGRPGGQLVDLLDVLDLVDVDSGRGSMTSTVGPGADAPAPYDVLHPVITGNSRRACRGRLSGDPRPPAAGSR